MAGKDPAAQTATQPRPVEGKSQQEVLTNESVITLVKAGLSENVIIAKIRSSAADFDLRTEALVALKQAGVSDRILEAMLSKVAGVAPGAPARTDTPTQPRATAPGTSTAVSTAASGAAVAVLSPAPVQVRESLIYVKDGREIEIDYTQGRRTMGGFIPPKMRGVFAGAKARFRVTEDRPTFYLGWNPTESPLVRLDSDVKDDERDVQIGRGAFPIFVEAREGPSGDDVVPVETEKLSSGYYRVTPKATLAKGEYGFLRLVGGVLGGQPRIYDFGRD